MLRDGDKHLSRLKFSNVIFHILWYNGTVNGDRMLRFQSLEKVKKGTLWRVTFAMGQCEWDDPSHGKFVVATSYESKYLVVVMLNALWLKVVISKEYECPEGSHKWQ